MDCGLFHLMEDFILKEVEYSQEHGYSSRAKRHMRRKLNRELAPYICNSDIESEQHDKHDENDKINFDRNESTLLPYRDLEICAGIAYVCVITTIYGVAFYIMSSYQNTCLNP